MGWIYLMLGGAFEVGFTTCLRHANGFRNLPWTLGFIGCVVASLCLLDLSLRTIPIGTSYAVWTGAGALGTVLLGMWVYGEPASALRVALICGLVACVAGLKITAEH
jgi:quaternary ammonium compound-resistance protein SugE